MEQRRAEKGLWRPVALPEDGDDDAKHADGHGRDGLDAVPLELDAGPRDADQKAGHTADEEKPADVVDALEFGENGRLLRRELDVEGDEDEAQCAEGKLAAKICNPVSDTGPFCKEGTARPAATHCEKEGSLR